MNVDYDHRVVITHVSINLVVNPLQFGVKILRSDESFRNADNTLFCFLIRGFEFLFVGVAQNDPGTHGNVFILPLNMPAPSAD